MPYSIRDVTPEATKAVLHREALGIVIAMANGAPGSRRICTFWPERLLTFARRQSH